MKKKGTQIDYTQVYSNMIENEGFTVNPHTGEAPSRGIAVAPAGNEERFPSAEASPASIQEYNERPENQARYARGASLGGWHDSSSGDVFLDTPTVYPETPGGQSRARNQMLKSDQIASYHIGKESTELNPFHPENRSYDIVSSDNSPSQQEMWRKMPRNITRTRGSTFTPIKDEGVSFT